MRKRILPILSGVVMITVGITGIVLFHSEQERLTVLHAQQAQQEQAQREARASAAQQKLSEERQRLEEMARQIESDRARILEEERQFAEQKRSKPMTLAQREAAPRPKAVEPPRKKEEPVRSADRRPAPQPRTSTPKSPVHDEVWTRSVDGRTSGLVSGDTSTDEMADRAGREAAESLRVVTYTNSKTGERVQANPFGYGRHSVRVRIRTWERSRLIADSFERFDRFSRIQPSTSFPLLEG